MAQQQIVTVTDDFDGSEGASQMIIGLDGVNYSIDLSEDNQGLIRDFLTPFIGAATEVRAATGKATAGKSKTPSEAPKIRAWARANGVQVGDRGRIAPEVTEAYRAAHAA